jgi:hypothetical protein
MKKIILFIAMLLFVVNVFSQDTTRQAYSKDYYLKKSRNQKTTGWVLLGTGTTLTLIGFVIGMNTVTNNLTYFGTLGTEGSPSSDDGASNFLIITGVTADLASIPFFISAGKNRRRAAEVALINQKMYLPQKNSVALRYVPGVTIRIGF